LCPSASTAQASALFAKNGGGDETGLGIAADPTGDWRVQDGVADIRVAECNGSMWGAVSWEKDPGGHDEHNPDVSKQSRPTLGMPILIDMKKKPGVDTWEGQVYNAKDGQYYSSTIRPLDPDHMPAAIRGIKFIAEKFPELPQVACFDTAFHRSLPKVARMYALPRAFYDQGIVRYGFHGLSYEYIMRELQTLERERSNGRVIIAHLGSGASVVAVKEGKSVDTSMGFTPLEGLVMSTRSGDVDPGALLYLLEQKNISTKELDTILNKKSGLQGVSAKSGDMRVLLDEMQTDVHAEEAVNLFCYRVKKYIGAYTAVLGGLDLLVFAGGIGEHAPLVRERICDGLDFLGIRLDGRGNEANEALISAPQSRVKVRVINTNEDLMIVRHVRSVLGWDNA